MKKTIGALMLAVVGSLLTTPAYAEPPTQPACLPLVAGTTGLLFAEGQLPAVYDAIGGDDGLGPVDRPSVARQLPDRVLFKDQHATFGKDFAFALLDGNIHVRRANIGVPLRGEKWHLLTLPECLAGHVTAISADRGIVVAVGPDRQFYSARIPGRAPSTHEWTWRWGPYFWTGSGVRMFPDVTRFATSTFDADETFTDTSGRTQHPIGVMTVYLLRGNGREITYLDPWLPQDDSRQVCGPRRGTTPLANLDATGCTIFAVGEHGDLYTRLYDFDVSGGNTLLGSYSWERDRPASDTAWQLPGPRWTRQPAPHGTITDRVSILRTGIDAADRLLVVEGRDDRGRRGYFSKPINAKRWEFVPTNQPLQGRALPLRRAAAYAEPNDAVFSGTMGGRRAVVHNFNPECSPARLTIRFPRGISLDVVLHSSDGLRQDMREPGLTDAPREYNGAIEIPRHTFSQLGQLPEVVQRWIAANLTGRFTTSPMAITSTRIRSLAQCWELTLNGEPARPDHVVVPDLGTVVGFLTEMNADQRTPVVCPPTTP